jgi:hypothetical protein
MMATVSRAHHGQAALGAPVPDVSRGRGERGRLRPPRGHDQTSALVSASGVTAPEPEEA